MRPATGYRHPAYAQALAEFGTPRALRRSAGSILTREIPGTDRRDAIGCYPLFACSDWRGLEEDLAELDDLVSLVIVADPFGDYDLEWLRRCFPDLARPFKEHFVRDLSVPPLQVTKHHRYYARQAQRSVRVETCEDPTDFAQEWKGLYESLVVRHGLTGVHAFSGISLTEQLATPGMVAFRASRGEATVGAHLWYVDGDVAYSHLAALSPAGYELGASYALHSYAIEYFSGLVRELDLGGGPGATEDATSGLAQFKRGWATGSTTAYLCGRVFDPAAYVELSAESAKDTGGYFPAYRSGGEAS